MKTMREPEVLANGPTAESGAVSVRAYTAGDGPLLQQLAATGSTRTLYHTHGSRRREGVLPSRPVVMAVAELADGPLAGAAWLENGEEGDAELGLILARHAPDKLSVTLLDVITGLAARQGHQRFRTCLDHLAYDFLADFRAAQVRVESMAALGGVTHVTLVLD